MFLSSLKIQIFFQPCSWKLCIPLKFKTKFIIHIFLADCVADNLCSDSADPMSNGHPDLITPNGLSVHNGSTTTTNGTSALYIVDGCGDAPQQLHAFQSPPPSQSPPPPSQPAKKEYIRVYDYLSNWSPSSESSCETHKTLVTQEMECQDAEMMDVNNHGNNATNGADHSDSAQEHTQSIAHAQGYDSKMCETLYDIGYGHAY